MRKVIFLLLGLRFATAIAQTSDLAQVLLSMPDSLMPMLSQSDRQDFLDYNSSGMTGRAKNRFGGESTMPLFGDRHLVINTSKSGSVQIGLFERKKGGTLICVVNTVSAGMEDSRLSFYDIGWNPVNADRLVDIPYFEDYLQPWVLKSDSLNAVRQASAVRMNSIRIVDDGLEFTYSSADFMNKEQKTRFSGFFRTEALKYRWNGRRFVRK